MFLLFELGIEKRGHLCCTKCGFVSVPTHRPCLSSYTEGHKWRREGNGHAQSTFRSVAGAAGALGPPLGARQRAGRAQTNSALGLLTDDHSRVLLKSENSHSKSDYINASPIVSTLPRRSPGLPRGTAGAQPRGVSRESEVLPCQVASW